MSRPSMTRAEKKRRDRMRQVVELRQKGYSLRVIARHLDVDHKTVAADLRRWEAETAKVTKFPGKFGGENSPASGENSPAALPSDNVVRLRRQA